MITLSKSKLLKFAELSELQIDGRSEFAYTNRLEHFAELVLSDLDVCMEHVPENEEPHQRLTARVRELTAEVERLKSDHNAVCVIVADMHAAAVGKVTGPKLGVVEDVKELRHQLLAAIKPLEDEIADYTRIIRKKGEENEAANREIVRLEMELASVKEENDTLRRVHKESIDILVKELSDKDYEYNQKTNRLIERHAEQLNRCDAEVKRLTGRKDGEVPNY